jgi:antitoxin (DNA-binding transcriptional repressor) of toxin-antitoxin stability system
MKFVSVKDFGTSSSNIWKKLPTGREMVITNNGRPIALLTPLSDETLEDTVSAEGNKHCKKDARNFCQPG